MISWIELQEEPEGPNQDLNQGLEERESKSNSHTEEGTTSKNEEEKEEEEVSVMQNGPDLKDCLVVDRLVLDWKDDCKVMNNNGDSNDSHDTRVRVGKPMRGSCPCGNHHGRLGYRHVGTAPLRLFDRPDCGKLAPNLAPVGPHWGKTFWVLLMRHDCTHMGVKLYHCTQCGKSFSESSHLICHQIIHSGEKPFQCNICGKRYGDSSYLTVHQRTHTGTRPYRCAHCGKCFGRSSTLIHHQRVHGNSDLAPGDKPRPRGIWTTFACLPGNGDSDSKHILSPQRMPTLLGSSLTSSILSPATHIDSCSMRIMGWQWGME